MGMAESKTTFYKDWTGVEFTWRRAEEHRIAARKFLEQLLEGPPSIVEGTDFFVLENERQYEALLAFRRELERSAGTGR